MKVKLLLWAGLLLLANFTQGKVFLPPPAVGSVPTLAQKVSFLAYTAKFGKSYSSTTEFNMRFKNWLATEQYLNTFANDQVQLRHNKFSDWTSEEINAVLNSKLALENVEPFESN